MAGGRTFAFVNSALVLLGLAICVLGPRNAEAGQSQNPPPAEPQAPFALKLESNLVVVRAVIRDAEGQPVKGLKREDFKIFDQGKERYISQFEEESSRLPEIPSQNIGATPSAPESCSRMAASTSR